MTEDPETARDGRPSGRERVLADAASRGLEVEIVERPGAGSLEEAAALLGIAPADIVKTLVVRRKTPQPAAYCFVLVPGDRQLSWSKLRELLGANKLDLPSEDTARAVTGYGRGSITPLGSTTVLPVYADSSVPGRRIAMGAGERGFSAFVDADALLASLSAVVADLSEPSSGTG